MHFKGRIKLLQEKWENLEQFDVNHSKFVTASHEDDGYISEIEDEDENSSVDDEHEMDGDVSEFVYSFGHRYNYWSQSLEHHVKKKYSDLRMEILQNQICKLRITEYIAAEKKAKIFRNRLCQNITMFRSGIS